MARIINPLWCSHFTHLLFQEVLAGNKTFCQVLTKHRRRVRDETGTNKNGDDAQLSDPNNETSCGEDSTDLTLKLSDGDLRVHRTFFIKVSSYFRCMLNSKCCEQSSSIVNLPGIDVLPMMLIVQYIYTGSVDLTTDTMLDVMALADYFHIASLSRLCCYFARSSMCLESCVAVHSAAEAYNYRALAWFALSYAARRSHLLVANVQAYLLSATANCLQALFNHPLLSLGSSLSTLQTAEAVKEWADHDPKSRYGEVTKILTAPQLCCLLHHHPHLRSVVRLHPQSTLPYTLQQCFDHARIRAQMDTAQVLFVMGGEECGRPSKTLECCHVRSASSPGEPEWRFLYPTCDVKRTLNERNLDAELSTLSLCRPCPAGEGDAALNIISSAHERVSFEVQDPELCKLLDDAYNGHVSVLQQLAAGQQQSSSRLPSRRVTMNTIAALDARLYPAAVTLEASNTFVVIGGLGESRQPLSSVVQFWPEKNEWLTLPQLPVAVYGACAAAVDDAILCVGGASKPGCSTRPGCSSRPGCSNALWRLGPECKAWEELPPLPGSGFCHAAAAVLNDCLYVLGGVTKCGTSDHFTNACWKYEPASKEWTQIASMHAKRAYHGAAVTGEELYAIGGYTGSFWLSSVERYCPLTDTWTKVQDMVTPRSSFAVTVSDAGIHVMGGFTGHRPSNEVECYTPRTGRWHAQASLHVKRIYGAAATVRLPCWRLQDGPDSLQPDLT